MNHMLVKFWYSLCVVSILLTALPMTAQAKKSSQSSEQQDLVPTAAVYGLAGECYLFYGAGGITVEQSPKPGMWHSNMRQYKICIDGSGISGANAACGNFTAVNVNADFNAIANFAYFVSSSAKCTLPTATAVAGKEIMICNASSGSTITYYTTNGETVSGNQSGALISETPYKVDRFISDGRNWYKE
jgi:hypothetical protein